MASAIPLPKQLGPSTFLETLYYAHTVRATEVGIVAYVGEGHIFTLLAQFSSAAYCNRSCMWVCSFVCVCVCGSVTMITRNRMHRSSPNWVCR